MNKALRLKSWEHNCSNDILLIDFLFTFIQAIIVSVNGAFEDCEKRQTIKPITQILTEDKIDYCSHDLMILRMEIDWWVGLPIVTIVF